MRSFAERSQTSTKQAKPIGRTSARPSTKASEPGSKKPLMTLATAQQSLSADDFVLSADVLGKALLAQVIVAVAAAAATATTLTLVESASVTNSRFTGV